MERLQYVLGSRAVYICSFAQCLSASWDVSSCSALTCEIGVIGGTQRFSKVVNNSSSSPILASQWTLVHFILESNIKLLEAVNCLKGISIFL